MTQNVRGQAGFTLMEMLIAGTLLAVMMGLVMGSMRVGVQAWDTGERRALQTGRLQTFQQFLRSHVANAVTLIESTKDPNKTPPPSFRGDRSSFEYVASLPNQLNRGGLYRFRYALVERNDRNDLKVAIEPAQKADDTLGEDIEDVVLLEGVEDMVVEYGGNDDTWSETWEEGRLPPLLRLRLTLAGEAPWPPLIVAFRSEDQIR